MNEYDRNIVSLLSKLFNYHQWVGFCTSLQFKSKDGRSFFFRGGRSDTTINSGFGSWVVTISALTGFVTGMVATGSVGYLYQRRARGRPQKLTMTSVLYFYSFSFFCSSLIGIVSGEHRSHCPGSADVAGLSSPTLSSGNTAPSDGGLHRRGGGRV